MSLVLVADPARVADPAATAADLGIGVICAGVPPGLEGRVTLPPAGWAVIRETWAGLDVVPGPASRAEIDALPDPGPDPAAAARATQEAAGAVLRILSTTPIDPVALDANLARLAAARAIPDPPAADIAALVAYLALSAPTAAATAAATKSLIRVLAHYPNVVPAQRATINVLGDVIRFLLQR